MKFQKVPNFDQETRNLTKLKGQYKHQCYDLNYQAIDETMLEFRYCECGFPKS